jgi:hypothetical protein
MSRARQAMRLQLDLTAKDDGSKVCSQWES